MGDESDPTSRNWHPDFDAAWLKPSAQRGPVVLGADVNPPDHVWGSVILLGNFDGLHVGHKTLLAAARRQAALLNAPLAIMSCEPHPKQFFNPGGTPFRLSNAEAKRDLCARLGIDLLFMPEFNATFAGLSANDFVTKILVGQLGVRAVVVGQDFHFGKARSGSVDDLRRLGEHAPFETVVVPDLMVDGKRISSSIIRSWIASGKLELVHQSIGRDWMTRSEITATGVLAFDPDAVLPPPGTYSVDAWALDGALLANLAIMLSADRTGAYLSTPSLPSHFLVSDWTALPAGAA